jgi:hypothetical protein
MMPEKLVLLLEQTPFQRGFPFLSIGVRDSVYLHPAPARPSSVEFQPHGKDELDAESNESLDNE